MQIANERRGQPRAALESTVIAFIGDERIECRAIDISATGIALLAPVVRPSGQFLRVNFALPGAGAPKWFDADGVVARVARVEQGVLLGVQFLVIEDRAAREVHAYVEFTRDANARARQQEVFVRRVSGGAAASTTSVPVAGSSAAAEVEEPRMPDAQHPPRATGEFAPATQRRTDSYQRIGIPDDDDEVPFVPTQSSPPTPSALVPRMPTPTGVVPPRMTSTGVVPRMPTPTGIAPPAQGPGAVDASRRAAQVARGASESSGSHWPGDATDDRSPQQIGTGRWPGEHAGSAGASSHSSGGGRYPGESTGASSSSHSTGGRPRVGTDPARPRVEEPRRSTQPPRPAPHPTGSGTPARRPTTATQRATDPPPPAPVSNKDLAALYRDALNEVEGKKGKKRK